MSRWCRSRTAFFDLSPDQGLRFGEFTFYELLISDFAGVIVDKQVQVNFDKSDFENLYLMI